MRKVHSSSKLIVHSGARLTSSYISIGANSTVLIESGATINSDLNIGENCNITFRRNSRVENTTFVATNGSTFDIGEEAIINSPVLPLSSVSIENGTFVLHPRAHLMSCSVLVRFGGALSIGAHTGIAYGSELRCEEKVEIGSYGMISYGVNIYDTNTHSIDWRERRTRIEQCYPEGVWEVTKPETAPVLIGDDVWIGKEVAITKGAQIGNRCIIGIRTVIGSGVIEDDSVIVAAKPRIIRRTQEISETIASLKNG